MTTQGWTCRPTQEVLAWGWWPFGPPVMGVFRGKWDLRSVFGGSRRSPAWTRSGGGGHAEPELPRGWPGQPPDHPSSQVRRLRLRQAGCGHAWIARCPREWRPHLALRLTACASSPGPQLCDPSVPQCGQGCPRLCGMLVPVVVTLCPSLGSLSRALAAEVGSADPWQGPGGLGSSAQGHSG